VPAGSVGFNLQHISLRTIHQHHTTHVLRMVISDVRSFIRVFTIPFQCLEHGVDGAWPYERHIKVQHTLQLFTGSVNPSCTADPRQ